MNETLAHIDQYFRADLTPVEKQEFEKKIVEDPAFAREVAFYVASVSMLKEESQKERKEQFRQLAVIEMPAKRPAVYRLWPYLSAAAVVAAIVLGLVFYNKGGASAPQLADTYIRQHLVTLGVTMSGTQDSMQAALELYNGGKLPEALKKFEAISAADTSSFTAKKYAGIVSLRLGRYDKALQYFGELESIPLQSNPGKFYRAVTLMKRNGAGDRDEAKMLLEDVVKNDLEGKQQAREWLDKW